MPVVVLLLALVALACKAEQTTEKHEEHKITDGVPQLPGVEGGQAEGAKKMTLGVPVQMDELGPLIINSDGTMKRVTNWDKMTPSERETSMRRIVQRNKIRRAELEKKGIPLRMADTAPLDEL